MCHVLIIEDEPLIALAIEMALKEVDATSFDIADCEEVAIASAHDRRPDLITSDVSLRVGIGPEAIRAIHREHGEIPVIFLTGTPEECIPRAPPGSILPKPFNG